jgi:hypothetical protein
MGIDIVGNGIRWSRPYYLMSELVIRLVGIVQQGDDVMTVSVA